MSKRKGPDLTIVADAIAKQKAQNEAACQALSNQLEDAQRRTFGSLAPSASTLPPRIVDDFTARRMALAQSLWASEVVTAAVIDDTFKLDVGKRAHQVLVDHKLVPADDPQQPATPAGPVPPLEGG